MLIFRMFMWQSCLQDVFVALLKNDLVFMFLWLEAKTLSCLQDAFWLDAKTQSADMKDKFLSL